MVADRLDALLGQFAGCRMVAFADLSTQMVLVTNTACTAPRETLDALCAEAAHSFGPQDRPALGHVAAGMAIIATADGLRIYLRAPDEPGDALCCVCDHSIVLDAFVPQARACLARISQDA